MKQKVLVCGVTGFIGRNIAERLAMLDQYEVIGVCHKKQPVHSNNIKYLNADLRNEADVRRVVNDVDIIIQAAATTSGSKDILSMPYIHVTDNAVMNSLIFRAAYDANVKQVVFFSCGVMYQPGAEPRMERDYCEADEIVPQYFGVGWTKVYTEKMCEFYSRLGRTRYTVLRQSNVYGPYDKYDLDHSHMFGANIRKIADASDGDEIVVWGEGKEARDLIYIDDVVRFVEIAIREQKTPYELCNVSCGKAYSVDEIVKMMIKASGKKIRIVYDTSKPSIPTRLALDNSRANDVFGWEPEMTLAEGIEKTMKWYKENTKC